MREIRHKVRGRPVTIHVVEHESELPQFVDWVKRNPELAFDTETTGLNIYQDGFRVRLAQFGTRNEAYVIPVELGEIFSWHVTCTLRFAKGLMVHNLSFEGQVAERHLGVPLLELFKKTVDTSILSRLWDSRAFKEGGPGHSLEELTRAVIDKAVADEVKGSMGALAKSLKCSKEEVFKRVDIFNPTYNLYAGMDAILAAELAAVLPGRIPQSAQKLVAYEHNIARICSEIERNGFELDQDYTKALIERLEQEETWWLMKVEEFTDDDEFQIGSIDEVARVLLDCGWDQFNITPTGRIGVDDAVLKAAAEAGIEFAEWIRQAKKASKWRKTWPEAFLSNMDSSGRCHASINTLQARTGRMSITGIPAQTLPSRDSLIRSCFVADRGHLIASVDYQAQELRVTAALSGDEMMRKAFSEGLDLHQITADAAGVPRKTGKMANFLTVYGGGWKALMSQGHVDEATAKRVLKAFAETYPGVDEYSQELQDEARRSGHIVTPTGRVLKVDRDRPYSAMNYEIQSTSRDITGSALIRLDADGYTPYMRLVIHDEVLFNFPADTAKAQAEEAGRIMRHVLKGVEVPTDPEVGGRSWGSLYEKAA